MKRWAIDISAMSITVFKSLSCLVKILKSFMNHTHFVEDYAFGLLPDKNVTDRLYGTIADPNKSSNLTKFCLANASFR